MVINQWQPTPVLLPGKSHGWRSLVQATIHGVAKSGARLSNFIFTFFLSTLPMRWPKYWSFSFSISPSKEHPGLISFRMDWLDLLESTGLSRVFTTPQFKSINSSALSFLHSPTLTSIHDYWKNHSLD